MNKKERVRAEVRDRTWGTGHRGTLESRTTSRHTMNLREVRAEE